MKVRKVLSLSGGRTSAYMLWLLLQEMTKTERAELIIIFANTGKERNETLDFLRDIEKHWNVEVVFVEYRYVFAREVENIYANPTARKNFEAKAEANEKIHWFEKVSFQKLKRRFDKGTPFDLLLNSSYKILPNVRARFCSAELKARTIKRYLFSIGVYRFSMYVGIRFDERHRVLNLKAAETKDIQYLFPLVEKRVDVRNVTEFWRNSDFDLQLESYEGNCDFCMLKSRAKLVRLMKEDPKGGEWWIKQEKESKATNDYDRFRLDLSYEEIKNLSKRKTILDMLAEESIKGIKANDEPACSCADGGFNLDEGESD